LSFRDANSRIVEEPFDEIDIESNSELYEATLVQPIRETPNETILLGLSFTHQDSDTFVMGVPLPFETDIDPAEVNDDDLGTTVSALRFFQEWTRRSQREVFAVRSSFNLGISAFGSTQSESGPDSEFFTWQGQAQYVRRLAPDTLFLLRANTQLASESLLSLEQFGIGGAGSVRGYRQDALIVDNGIFASAEVRLPIARVSKWNAIVWVAPFFDYGRGGNTGGVEDPETQNLASLGVGLRLQVDDWLNANVDFGVPLIGIEGEGDTLQEDGFLFSFTINPLEF
ncbi:MAG: ShlB/FhaC/HecB family hemolysin secretion/activation protein, partial [Cyanobacteria bacterium J06641_5]